LGPKWRSTNIVQPPKEIVPNTNFVLKIDWLRVFPVSTFVLLIY
jgi:hypothetical protein